MDFAKFYGTAPLLACAILFYLFDGTVISTILASLLLAISLVLIVTTTVRFVVTKNFLHAIFGEDREGLLKLRTMTSRLFHNTSTFTYSRTNAQLFLIAIPYLCVALLLGNWWAIPLLSVVMVWGMGWRQLSPPLAAFLSSSGVEQIRLCADVQRRIWPLRIINLLHLEQVQAARKEHGSQLAIVALDGNRLISSDRWEQEVENVLSCVPLVILDLRTISSQLEAECAIINRGNLHWKLAIVHGGAMDEVQASVCGFSKAQRDQIAWLRADELPKTIVHSIALEKRLPTRDRPAGHVLIPPVQDYKQWYPGMSLSG